MNPRPVILALCTAIGLAACNRPPAPLAAFDPVADLKALASKLKGAEIPSVTVDVRKTDSLTAPFVGTISGTEFGKDEKGVLWSVVKFALDLDYREGKWEFRQCTGNVWRKGQDEKGEQPFVEKAGRFPVCASGLLKKLGIESGW